MEATRLRRQLEEQDVLGRYTAGLQRSTNCCLLLEGMRKFFLTAIAGMHFILTSAKWVLVAGNPKDFVGLTLG